MEFFFDKNFSKKFHKILMQSSIKNIYKSSIKSLINISIKNIDTNVGKSSTKIFIKV